jgi:hypothetical protein
MARSSAIQNRKESDAYATRAVLVELLKALNDSDPAIISRISGALASAKLRPDDVPVPDPTILEAARMILAEVE